jgi:uncharacterized protein with beta-barrel porin domain
MGGYYRGDYYRGDYYGYRGDPGLFSFFGKALGGIVKLGGGLLKSELGLSTTTKQRQQFNGGYDNVPAHISRPLPPTTPGGGTNGGGSYGANVAAIPTLTAGSLGPTGKRLHPNRSTYETRGGGTSRWPHALQLHPKGTVLVASRRRNVGNAKALRHALSRVAGFAHLARKVMSFVHPRAGRGHFKFAKRKRLRA